MTESILSPAAGADAERRLLAEHVTEGTTLVHRGRPWPPHLGRLYRPMTAEERTRADAAIARITGELRDERDPAVPDDGSYPDGAPVAESEGTQQ